MSYVVHEAGLGIAGLAIFGMGVHFYAKRQKSGSSKGGQGQVSTTTRKRLWDAGKHITKEEQHDRVVTPPVEIGTPAARIKADFPELLAILGLVIAFTVPLLSTLGVLHTGDETADATSTSSPTSTSTSNPPSSTTTSPPVTTSAPTLPPPAPDSTPTPKAPDVTLRMLRQDEYQPDKRGKVQGFDFRKALVNGQEVGGPEGGPVGYAKNCDERNGDLCDMSFGIAIPTGSTRLVGELILSDDLSPSDMSMTVEVSADGLVIQSATLTKSDPFQLAVDVSNVANVSVRVFVGTEDVVPQDVHVAFVGGQTG